MATNIELFRIIDLKAEENNFRKQLNEQRKLNKFTDVEIQIRDKHFPAHRNVLSVDSPVLETAISDQWSTTKICSISDEYVDPEIVEDLLSFLYTGCIELTPDNVHPVCVAASFLQIPTLLEPSVDYLCELIRAENVLKLFLFSISSQLDVLRKSCLRYIIANYEKVFQDPEVLDFRFESLKCLILGLKEHFWGTDLREHTFACIVRWTENNLPERLEHLPILLENIPLAELPVEFLEKTVSTHPLVKECFSGSKILSDAITNNEISWKTKENFIVIGGYSTDRHGKPSKSMFSYDFKTESWKQLPDISEDKAHFAATVVDGGNISGGSISEFTKTGKVEMFDWFTQTWMSMPPMPLKLARHWMAVLNGVLYVAAGQELNTNGGMFTRCETKFLRYSFESKQWSDVKMPAFPGNYCRLLPYKDHLYAIGWDRFEEYDPSRDNWTVLPPPKTHNASFAATLHNDRFYLCSERMFEVYDPETNTWTSLPAPAVGETTSLLSVNGKLLAVGGRLLISRIETDSIYEFDLRTEQWNVFGKLPKNLVFHRCLVGLFH